MAHPGSSLSKVGPTLNVARPHNLDLVLRLVQSCD